MIAFFINYKSLSDGQLMERVRRKDDEQAFAELYRRYTRLLQGFFFRRLGGDAEKALDHMQDTFLKVWSSRWNYLVYADNRRKVSPPRKHYLLQGLRKRCPFRANAPVTGAG